MPADDADRVQREASEIVDNALPDPEGFDPAHQLEQAAAVVRMRDRQRSDRAAAFVCAYYHDLAAHNLPEDLREQFVMDFHHCMVASLFSLEG
jgi:hypothetical protein